MKHMKHSSIFPRTLPPRTLPPPPKKTKSAATQNFGKVAVPGVMGSDGWLLVGVFCGAVEWLGADRIVRGFC